MPLKDLGSKIQAARQAKGLSIEDIASKLKIHRRILRAIENGSLDEMPEPVYARSFTRAYAAHVGIAPEILQEAVDQAFPLQKTPEYTDKTDRSTPSLRASRRASSKSLRLTCLAVFILIAAGAWYYFTYVYTPDAPISSSTHGEEIAPAAADENADSPSSPVHDAPTATPASGSSAADMPTASAGDVQAPDVAVPAPSENSPAADLNPQAAVQPASQAGNADQTQEAQAAVQPSSRANSAVQAQEPQATQAPQPIPAGQAAWENRPVSTNDGHSLVISANESAWFSIMVDGVQRSYTFQQGDSAEFTFERQATLRMGNAGGISIIYDGAPLPQAGRRGEVRTMSFPPTAQ